MSRTKIFFAVSLVCLLLLLLVSGCGKEEPTEAKTQREINKEAADRSIQVLGGLYGAGRALDSQGGNAGSGAKGPVTFMWDTTIYIDESSGGVRWYGDVTISDGGTSSLHYFDSLPEDPDSLDLVPDSIRNAIDDDWWQFDGTVEYIDWGFSETWVIKIFISPWNRTTSALIVNSATDELAAIELGKVNRPGGVHSGNCYYVNPNGDTTEFTELVYHSETPFYDEDNWTVMGFNIFDEDMNIYPVYVHFYPDDYGWIVDRSLAGYVDGAAGNLIATFYCNILGYGEITLIDGYTYPFRF